MKEHIISALVDHKPGVMQRIASMFSRRKFNIESITVGATDNKDIARMTIITRGDDAVLEQILKQMNKLVNIIKVHFLQLVKNRKNGGLIKLAPLNISPPLQT